MHEFILDVGDRECEHQYDSEHCRILYTAKGIPIFEKQCNDCTRAIISTATEFKDSFPDSLPTNQPPANYNE